METDILLPSAKRRRGPGKGGEASRRHLVYEREAGVDQAAAAATAIPISRQLVQENRGREYDDAPGGDSSTCSPNGADIQPEAYQIQAGAAGGSSAWNKRGDRRQQRTVDLRSHGSEDLEAELDREAAGAEAGPSLGEGTEAGSTEQVHQDDADLQVVESFILDVDCNGHFTGDRALQQAFLVETAGIRRRADSTRVVPVSCHVGGQEFKHRLRLASDPAGSLYLKGTSCLNRILGLTRGDKVRLSIRVNGRAFVELAAPAATGREWTIQLSQSHLSAYVILPISASEMLLGLQVARQLNQVIPLHLDPRVATHQGPEPPGISLSKTENSRCRPRWRIQGLTSWFQRQGAVAGDCLVLRSVRGTPPPPPPTTTRTTRTTPATALPAVVASDQLHRSGLHNQQASNGPYGTNVVVYFRLENKGIDLGAKTLRQPLQSSQPPQLLPALLAPQLLQVLQLLHHPQPLRLLQIPQQPPHQVEAQGGQQPHQQLLLLQILQSLLQQQANADGSKRGALPPGTAQLLANAVRQRVLGEAAAVGRLVATPASGHALLCSLVPYSNAASTAAATAPSPAGPAVTRQPAIPPPQVRPSGRTASLTDGVTAGKEVASETIPPAPVSATAGGQTVGFGAAKVFEALCDWEMVRSDLDSGAKLSQGHQQSASAAAVAAATAGQAEGGPPVPVIAPRAQPDPASLRHLHGCVPHDADLPTLQPGEVRVCRVTFAADLKVQQLQTAWRAKQLCTLAPQQQICVPFSATEGGAGPSAAEADATFSARRSAADVPWVAAFRGPNALTVLPICYELSRRLGLTQDCTAPLPEERLQPVQVEVRRDPVRLGEGGLFATQSIPRNRVICIMEGFVKAQLPDGNDVFMERGHHLLPETSRQQLQQRVAACGGEADVELFWRFLVAAFRMIFPGHEELRAAYPGLPALELQMLGHGGMAAYVNDPRFSWWEEGEQRGVQQCNASLAANCVVVPVLVRGVPLPVLVALRDITTGEQLLRDCGEQWWHDMEEWRATLRIFSASPADVLHDPGAADALPPPPDQHRHCVEPRGEAHCRSEESGSYRELERQHRTIQAGSAAAVGVAVAEEEVAVAEEHGHSSHDIDRCGRSGLHSHHQGKKGVCNGSHNSSCTSEGRYSDGRTSSPGHQCSRGVRTSSSLVDKTNTGDCNGILTRGRRPGHQLVDVLDERRPKGVMQVQPVGAAGHNSTAITATAAARATAAVHVAAAHVL
ncbi:hypothetical protein Vafri_18599 [Volvox africanus]|uniref:SET domain-containing protein n=1 Tax=Volvox africanus TaxID=51714 RepID=A0A8J4BMK5_9CHLO|nr:hypothetical protein Vafri_18599 [Volvox africanus]